MFFDWKHHGKKSGFGFWPEDDNRLLWFGFPNTYQWTAASDPEPKVDETLEPHSDASLVAGNTRVRQETHRWSLVTHRNAFLVAGTMTLSWLDIVYA